MKYMDEQLYKVFSTMPVKGVFGNYGENSRYRLLAKLAGWTSEQSRHIGSKIRDKMTVVLYPDIYGDRWYLLRDGHGEVLESIEKLEDTDDGADGLLIPAVGIRGNYLTEFPADCQDIYDPLFGSSFMQGLFFEAFPYDKKSFEDLVFHMVTNLPSRVPLRIVLIQNEVQYGATDVTAGEAAITKAMKSMKKYTEEILICSEKEADARLLKYHIDLRGQYMKRKSRLIEKVKKDLEQNFDREFQEAKERFLLQESGTTPGILSSICFMEAADYNKVKKTGLATEKAIFNNYIETVRLAKEDLKSFVDSVWSCFMYDIAPFSEKEREQWFQSWIGELIKGYHQRTSFLCPNNPIDYRRQLTESKLVVELERYVNSFENGLKNWLYRRMKEQLKKCEEKYI